MFTDCSESPEFLCTSLRLQMRPLLLGPYQCLYLDIAT